ncbi:MAG: hypothetical protein IKI72_10010 [Bacteroidales bacterium]|jgi:hypothetical protein|nr:hypothetical protein [Bacteroidales bacterium]
MKKYIFILVIISLFAACSPSRVDVEQRTDADSPIETKSADAWQKFLSQSEKQVKQSFIAALKEEFSDSDLITEQAFNLEKPESLDLYAVPVMYIDSLGVAALQNGTSLNNILRTDESKANFYLLQKQPQACISTTLNCQAGEWSEVTKIGRPSGSYAASLLEELGGGKKLAVISTPLARNFSFFGILKDGVWYDLRSNRPIKDELLRVLNATKTGALL